MMTLHHLIERRVTRDQLMIVLRALARIFLFVIALPLGIAAGTFVAFWHTYLFLDEGYGDIGTNFSFLSLAFLYGSIGVIAAEVMALVIVVKSLPRPETADKRKGE